MIHTAEFHVELKEVEAKIIERMYNIKLHNKMSNEELKFKNTSGIRCVFMEEFTKYKFRDGIGWRVYLYVNFQELMDKVTINISDGKEIVRRIDKYVRDFSGSDIELARLDLKYDVQIPNERIRQIMIKMLNKCIDKRYFMIKKKNGDINGVRYISKSRSTIVYDKEVERIDKSEKIESYEENVLRYEAHLYSRHMRYKRKNYKINRDLLNYFNEESYKKYMKDMIIAIFHTGDYYNYYYASQKIDASNLKVKEKEELKNFIKKVSKAGITAAKSNLTNHFYKKYLDQLDKLNINPVLIPMQDRIDGKYVPFIPNPLKELQNKYNI